jgi:hypothetical protein
LINNAFKNACEKDSEVNNVVSAVQEFPEILQMHIKEIGATCPKLISIRWISIFGIIDFVQTHAATKTFIFLPENYDDFAEVTTIFRALIEIFEDSKTSLATVFPVLTNARFALHELLEKGNNLALKFIESLSHYTIGSKRSGIWALAYLFTPNGRNTAQSRLNDPQKEIKYQGFVKEFYVKRKAPLDAIDEGIQQLTTPTIDSLLEDDDGLSFGDPPQIDLTKHLAPTEGEDLADPEPTSLQELEDQLTCDDDPLTVAATEYLKDSLSSLGCGPARIAMDVKTFKEFVLYNKSPLTIVENLRGHKRYDFLQVRAGIPEWRFLADLALRLEACPPSEASCERTISSQRLILTCHNLRSDKKLLEARLTFMKGFEK